MSGIKKKPHLPKAVLDMKFMRRTKERLENENTNTEDHSTLYSRAITDEMRTATSNYISESSFTLCEELMEGRLSFKGMNPEIERLMELETVTQEPNDGEMEKDVSDEILVKKMQAFNKRKRHYSSPRNYVGKRKK